LRARLDATEQLKLSWPAAIAAHGDRNLARAAKLTYDVGRTCSFAMIGFALFGSDSGNRVRRALAAGEVREIKAPGDPQQARLARTFIGSWRYAVLRSAARCRVPW